MIAIRARLWVLYYLVWVIVLFCVGVLFIRWTLEIGLSHFFIVLPEWILWTIFCFAVLRFTHKRVKLRSKYYQTGKVYRYSSSEPRHVAKIVEELCLKRHWHLPHIIIIKDRKKAGSMLDENQRPDILILEESMIDTLTPDQLRGVIAHELRHSDATDTKLIHMMLIINTLFNNLWTFGGISYLLFSPTSLLDKLWAIVWGVGLALLVRVAMNLLLKSMSRAMEYKTDILSCLDTGNPSALLSTLSILSPGYRSESYYLKGRHSFILLAFLDWLSSAPHSHPTNDQRTKVLNRVFGH